ncbi:hypothetical protein KQX54_008066 [Cotesia glomerata]|uniref:Uncharacterized protein n=1 Tax=Cotesia glomerata TaxID=32391 RepID=A0AAV7J5D9_COTGL|nr:hypothetical protein KQX54_008066 [Cotesia glomerata]
MGLSLLAFSTPLSSRSLVCTSTLGCYLNKGYLFNIQSGQSRGIPKQGLEWTIHLPRSFSGMVLGAATKKDLRSGLGILLGLYSRYGRNLGFDRKRLLGTNCIYSHPFSLSQFLPRKQILSTRARPLENRKDQARHYGKSILESSTELEEGAGNWQRIFILTVDVDELKGVELRDVLLLFATAVVVEESKEVVRRVFVDLTRRKAVHGCSVGAWPNALSVLSVWGFCIYKSSHSPKQPLHQQ